jgi:hypothetical protein
LRLEKPPAELEGGAVAQGAGFVLKLRRSALLRDADTMSISSAGRLSRFDMLDELVRCVDRVDSGDV